MSSIDCYLEKEEAAKGLVAALKELCERGMIESDVSKGIAKKVVTDRHIDGLSDKQLNVFRQYIQPLLEPECEGFCGGVIDIFDLPSALGLEVEEGGLYCQHCIHDNRRIREQ